MTKDEALKTALEALVTLSEQSDCDIDSFTFGRFGGNTAITAIKEALALTSTQCEKQPPEPRNFCPRCGKRTADLTVIHTCTPPEGGHQ
jgi:hypothetical protein